MVSPSIPATLATAAAASLGGILLGPLLRRLALCRPHDATATAQRGHGSMLAPSSRACSLLCSIVYLTLALRLGPSLKCLEAIGIASVLVVASAADLDRRVIPNWAVATACLVRLSFLVASGLLAGRPPLAEVPPALVGGLAVSLPTLLLGLAMRRFTGQEGIGGGDVKLLFAVGLCLGPLRGLLVVLLACALGVSLVLTCSRLGRGQSDDTFAFGPPIAIACWAATLLGS